jgi:hypothetical protein
MALVAPPNIFSVFSPDEENGAWLSATCSWA